jgi:hypothetical protein
MSRSRKKRMQQVRKRVEQSFQLPSEVSNKDERSSEKRLEQVRKRVQRSFKLPSKVSNEATTT